MRTLLRGGIIVSRDTVLNLERRMTTRVRPMFLLAVLLALPHDAAAQNLTGEWTIVESIGGTAEWSSPLGARDSITQGADTITVSPAVFRSNFQGERVYRLDGSDARNNITDASGDIQAVGGRLRKALSALIIEDGPTVFTLSLNASGQLEILVVSENLWPERTANTRRFVYRKTP